MSRVICQYCGTYYNSEEGKCPICGAAAEIAPAPQPEEKKSPVKDDTIVAMGKLFSKTAKEAEAPAAEQAAPVEAPKPAAQEIQPPKAAEEAVAASAPAEPEQRKPQQAKPAGETAPAKKTVREPEPPKAENKQTSPAPAAPKAQSQPRPSGKPAAPAKAPQRKKKKEPVATKDKVICIVLGIIAALLALYIAYRFLRPGWATGSSQTDTQPSTTSATEAVVSCTGVSVDGSVTFTAKGQAQLLNVILTPADTTDSITFQSDNAAVATVSAEGLVTAVAPGEANITVTCGSASAVCPVYCDFTEETEPSETTAPTETTEPPTETTAPEELALDRTDITFFSKGETTRLKVGSLSPAEIQWSSDNSGIATVENGKVTAVAPGTTRVRAVYNGTELVCIVRCNFEDETEATTAAPEDGDVTISHTDVTLDVDETFTLRLRDGAGNTLDVSWSVGNTNVCTVSGNTVTAVGSGYTEVSCTYDGETYTCVVRVR